jgi:hypothetical protein
MSKRKSKFGNMTTDNTGKVNATRTNTYEQAFVKVVKDLVSELKGEHHTCPDVDVDDVLSDLYNQSDVEVSKGVHGERRYHLKGGE